MIDEERGGPNNPYMQMGDYRRRPASIPGSKLLSHILDN